MQASARAEEYQTRLQGFVGKLVSLPVTFKTVVRTSNTTRYILAPICAVHASIKSPGVGHEWGLKVSKETGTPVLIGLAASARVG